MSTGLELPSGTVTFLFTDIEGSTTLLKSLGDSYAGVLDDHRRLLRGAFTAHGGREIDTQGDSFFFVFARAKHAIQAAIDAQRALVEHAWPEGAEVRVRMGLHSGEPLVGEDRYVGIGVNRAARIGAAAHGGQVLVSDATRALVEDDLPPGVFLRDLGHWRLKDIDRPERVSQLVNEGLRSDFPPLRGTERKRSNRRLRLVAPAALVVIAAAVVAGFLLTSSPSGSAQAFAGVAADSVGVFNSRSGGFVAQTQVKTGPSSIASGMGAVWVANVDDNSVSRIDPKTNAVVQTIGVGSEPSGVAVGDGFVWVSNYADGTVSQIDPGTNGVVRTIQRVGSQPAGIAFGEGGVWVANAGDRTVVRIEPGSGVVDTPIPVDAGADAIAVGDSAVWVASQSAGVVTRIDPRSGSGQPINVGSGPTALAVTNVVVWVANSLGDTVSQIDPATNQVKATVPVGAGPSGIAATAGLVWVSNEQGGTLSRIDPSDGKVVQTIDTGNRPADIALNGQRMYVAVRTSSLAHRGGTLRVVYGDGYGQALDHFDTALAYDFGWQMLLITNDGLVTFQRAGGSEGGRIVPDLAVALPQPTDGSKTYTFLLRPGIRYSNGAPVRPADFRRPIERGLESNLGPGPSYYTGIVGAKACLRKPSSCDLSKGIVTATNPDTVTFHLAAPDPDFLYKLALPSADSEPADTPLKAHLPFPATGPYMIASYQANGSAHLVRNPRFREWSSAAQPAGYPDEINVDEGFKGSIGIRAVEQGKADLTTGSDSALRVRYAGQLHDHVGLGSDAIFLDTRLPPFNNLEARQAFNYAVDRNRLVQLGGGPGSGQPTCQILPPNIPGYHPYCPYTRHPTPAGAYHGPDLAKAKRLVAASRTQGQTVTLWTACCGKPSSQIRYLLSVLRSLGYKPQIKPVSPRLYQTEYLDPHSKWQVVPIFGDFADYPAASTFFLGTLSCASFTATNNANFSEFCRPRIDAEMKRASALQSSNPQAAAKLWARVDHDIVDQAPWVPYANPRDTDFVSRRVGNYINIPLAGALLDQLWVR